MQFKTRTATFLPILWMSLLAFPVSQARAQFTINNVFGNLTDCDTMTRGIYIVWWDHDFDYASKVDALLDTMIRYRTICLNDLSMADPPNPDDGYYYNVYIHTPGNSNDIFFPYNWGNGQGTDINGYPFLTLPNGVLQDWVNNAHETFHIFQYNATSPGFSYSGDSQWYIEASANWFAAKQNPGSPRAFVEAESLVRIPQVPLWLSYNNYPSSYPSNWQRYVHQYALALMLYYLTDVGGAPDSLITAGLFSGTLELPQEYFYNQLGGDIFRDQFINCAAHMTNQFDFIPPLQSLTNENEWNTYADPADDLEFIETYTNEGTAGWYRPIDTATTNAWSYNTYKVHNDLEGSYTFELRGDATGSYGDSAFFQGKILIQNGLTGSAFYDLSMTNALEGTITLEVTPNDTALYFIIASMPEIFGDSHGTFQLFPYEMRITQSKSTAVNEPETTTPRFEVARFNLLGQPAWKSVDGFQVILFNDGSVQKVFVCPAY